MDRAIWKLSRTALEGEIGQVADYRGLQLSTHFLRKSNHFSCAIGGHNGMLLCWPHRQGCRSAVYIFHAL